MFRWFEGLVDPFKPAPDGPVPTTAWRFAWHFAGQMKGVLIVGSALGAGLAMVQIVVYLFIGDAITSVEAAVRGESDIDLASLLVQVPLLLTLLVAINFFGASISNQSISSNLVNMVRWQGHKRVVRQDIGFFQRDSTGRIAFHVMETGQALTRAVTTFLYQGWHVIVLVIGALVVLTSVYWAFLIPLLLWLIAATALNVALIPMAKARAEENAAMRADVNGRIIDSYSNVENVKLFAGAETEDTHIRDGILGLLQTAFRLMRVDTGWNAVLVALNAALLASVFAMSVVLWNRGALPVGTVVVAVSLVYRLQAVAFALQGASQQIFQSIGQITEGAKSLARPLPEPPTGGWRDEPVPTEAVAITLKNVEFGYRPGEPVIHGLDLDVAAGEKVGIVGPSGGGKTTLIRLVAGLRVPDQGSVTLEGREVRDIPEDQRRALLSVVAQDVALFNRSIRENITYGLANAADEDVWRALQRAQAAKFVPGITDDDERKGLDAVVGERGSGLSAGQRQRIAIARALIRETPILIMDEASSALDSRTEEALQQELDSHMSGKTVLAVAHRLSTVAKMDRIIVVEDGRITDQGKHDELIARGGTYAELWSLQAHQQTAGLS